MEVDPMQDDKAKEIQLCSFSRPHMRAFHCIWYESECRIVYIPFTHVSISSPCFLCRWSFFIAFFIWFAISPLLPHIAESLDLSKDQVWTSSIAGVGSTILVRFILGPLCDIYGARVLFSLVLCGASIPTACTGLIKSARGLYTLRACIGTVGGTFVMTEFWATRMFTKEVVGTANALVAGWGNLGASVTQLVMGSFLFPLFTTLMDDDAERAWRTVCIVPAVVGFITGVTIFFISDDAPKGNYTEMKRHGIMGEVSGIKSFWGATYDMNTWIMFIQYAACFGVELTMNNAAALYFRVSGHQAT